MPKINYLRLFICTLVILLMLSLVLSYVSHETKNISNHVLRLHIIANSDSDNDQELKLKVRDEVIKRYGNMFSKCENAEKSKIAANENLDDIKALVDNVIRENGFSYTSDLAVTRCTFPTKRYVTNLNKTISLPSGEYDALSIRIGDADGKNWWCVMYPPLCFVDGVLTASDETLSTLEDELSDDEYSFITSQSDMVQIKFKIAELLSCHRNN